MEELNELLTKYQTNLQKADKNLELFIDEFPVLHIENDISKEITIDILNYLKKILNKINLPKELEEKFQEAIAYYKLNEDLDLTKLLVYDQKYLNFIDTIKKVYRYALKYKIDMVTNYHVEIKKLTEAIENMKQIKQMLESSTFIDTTQLENLLKTFSFSDEITSKILSQVFDHNSFLTKPNHSLQEEKKESELETSSLSKIDLEAISSLSKKMDYYLKQVTNYLASQSTFDNDVYLFQSRLVEMGSELTELASEYEACVSMMQIEKDAYLEESLNEIQKKIISIKGEFEELISTHSFLFEFEKEVEKNSNDESNHLIFLSPVLKDIEAFKKENCQINEIKKLYEMLKRIEKRENIPITNYVGISTQFPVNVYMGGNTSASPRIFYQTIQDQIIIIYICHAGDEKQATIKNTIQLRTNANFNNEYKTITNALLFAPLYPERKSQFNSNLTNQEFKDQLFLSYQERSQAFWEKFYLECYYPEEKKR